MNARPPTDPPTLPIAPAKAGAPAFNPCSATACIYHNGKDACTLPPVAVSIGKDGMCTAMETDEGEGGAPQSLPVRPASPPTPPPTAPRPPSPPVGGGNMATSGTMPRTIPPANTPKSASVNRKKNNRRVPPV